MRQFAAARLVGLCLTLAAAERVQAQPAPQPPEATASAALPAVSVFGRRLLQIGPLPGTTISREQIPSNVQSADAADLRRSGALSIAEFMNAQMPSVSVNDYAGNPYQFDLSYRGFTASPQIGTPQGLSVFFDGVRVNEPFGDVVNWDLLPMNAIERFDVFPGSNPLFGLNTLGGALSLRSKSGFSAPGVELELSAGAAGRRQLQLSAGFNDERHAGFVALNHFEERGWRDNSPSSVQQLFARVDMRRDWGTAGASLLVAGNRLVGNGLIPLEIFDQRRSSVFTSPDRTKNRLAQGSVFATLELDEGRTLTVQAYRRHTRRKGLNGDIYEDFDDFDEDRDIVRGPAPPRTSPLPACQWLDADRNGLRDTQIIRLPDGSGVEDVLLPPLNDPRNEGLCDTSRQLAPPGPARNGAEVNGPGVVAGTPIGLLSRTDIGQTTDGLAVQLNWDLPRHQVLLGASLDASRASYRMAQRLGLIDPSHNVYEAPDQIDVMYRAAQEDIRANDFDGRSRTRSLFFSETFTPRRDLHLSVAGRFNHTTVDTRLLTRSALGDEAGALHALRNFNLRSIYLLCPTADPASCPATPQPVLRDVSAPPVTRTGDNLTYRSFNPSAGFSWLPRPGLNLFGSLSRGARTPSVVELGCAFDATMVNLNAGLVDEFTGQPLPALMRPRSLVGPTCSLPTTLSGDPFLPQIRSTSAELGGRGRLDGGWDWNASVYRTDLRDDIYFVGVSAERSFFDTIGKTRRQGLEFGIKGSAGPLSLRLNYGYTRATFESRFYVLSPHNSSADFDQNSQPGSALPTPTAFSNGLAGTYRMTRVDPGARLPGIPLHNLNASVEWSIVTGWMVALSMVAHSGSFVRGNENNAHQARGNDAETQLYFGGPTTGCDAQGYCGSIVGGGRTAGRPFTQPGRVPGFASFNLRTAVVLQEGLELLAGVNNLFDRRYATAGRLGVNPFSPSVVGAIGPSGWNYNSSEWRNSTFIGPAAPRAGWLALSYRYGSH